MAKYKKRKDGRYAANVVIGFDEETGKRIYAPTIYAKSISELESKKSEIKVSLNNGTYADDKGTTIKKWGKTWLDIYKSSVEDATKDRYEYAIRKMDAIHDIRLMELKKTDVQKLLNDKSDNPETQRIIRLTLRQMLECAIDDGLIYKNVARNVTIEKSKKKYSGRRLTEAEQKAIASCDFELKEKAYIYMLYYTGIRPEEALALTKSDVDLKHEIVHINKAITWKDKNFPVKIKSTKSEAGNRDIPIAASLSPILRLYMNELNNIYLFPQPDGSMMQQKAYQRFFDNIRGKINIKLGGTNDKKVNGRIKEHGIKATDLTAYTFRHNYASMLYDVGVDVKEAQYLLGHSDISITLNIYTHLDENKANLKESIKKLKTL